MVDRETINPPELFDSLGYGFSQAVSARSTRRLHLSGQVATDQHEWTTHDTLGGQLNTCLDNIEIALRAGGAQLEDVVVLRIYITEAARSDLAPVKDALLARFPVNPPAATWLIVTGLARDDWLVEVEAEAAL